MSRPAQAEQRTGGAQQPHTLPAPNRPQIVPEPPETEPKRGAGWLWLLLLGVLAGAGLFTWQDVLPRETRGAAVASTPTLVVEPQPFIRSLRLTGSVSARESVAIRAPRLRVRSQLTLTELAEAGTMVKAGDVVARFESRELEDRVDDMTSNRVQREAQLERERAKVLVEQEAIRQQRDRAKAEYDKAVFDLRKAEVLSQIEGEILRNTAAQAKAEWQQLEGELELQQDVFKRRMHIEEIDVQDAQLRYERYARDLERMVLRAPVSGLVVLEPMYKGGGQFQQASLGDQVYPGTTFLQVVDLSSLHVSAAVNQVDAGSIRVGQPALVYFDAYPGIEVEGRVSNVGAIAGSAEGFGSRNAGLYVKTIPVDIAFQTKDPRIIPDLSAAVDIQLERQADQLLAPLSAVQRRDGQTFVFLRQGNSWVERPIELGEANDTAAIVLSGLEPGDEIALEKPAQT
ncbi:MAG: efflux RND transporter periplasmic adaptor subunit [Bryobacterales bacterium]|nr:efflux RND transporter periplasmic adaptor subunit [Acidobacteriota bacterium]MCB9385758.1 efflux RND transporter periplasmic adaptor subunit [Bryobacterales bacterium]